MVEAGARLWRLHGTLSRRIPYCRQYLVDTFPCGPDGRLIGARR
ncbi:hypothetical protein DSC45_26185 [Streptomyces sp. YIM 130001]|nr:hypothetical protein DSC45_26185 [Streptomyces sp. YIM 130001]